MERAGAEAAVGPAAPGSRGGRPRVPLAFALAALFWSTFAVFVAVQTWLSMLTHGHSLPRLVAYQLVVCWFWIAATPLVAFLARRFPVAPWRWSAALVHLSAAAACGVGFFAWLVAASVAIRPYDVRNITAFSPAFFEKVRGQLPLEMLVYLGTLGAVCAFDFLERSRERALRAAHLERELANARLDALAAQLQPHFLFNALHTVSGQIRGQENQAAIATIAALSDILRYALDASGAPEVPLEEELDVTRRYLAIQRLRYGERLEVALEPGPGTARALVPRLLLQPLVENAIRHGVGPSASASWLALSARREGEALRIVVSNGVPAAPPAGDGLGIGLRNTRARLEQLYGAGFTMEARPFEGRYEVELRLPWRTAGEEGRADG